MMYGRVNWLITIPVPLYMTSKTQKYTRGHGLSYVFQLGASTPASPLQAATIRIWNQFPAGGHVPFHRGIQVSIGRQHGDSDVNLETFAIFISARIACFHQLQLDIISCYKHFIHTCHARPPKSNQFLDTPSSLQTFINPTVSWDTLILHNSLQTNYRPKWLLYGHTAILSKLVQNCTVISLSTMTATISKEKQKKNENLI